MRIDESKLLNRQLAIIDDAVRLYGEDLHLIILYEITEDDWDTQGGGRIVFYVHHHGEGSQGVVSITDLGYFADVQTAFRMFLDRIPDRS